MTTSEKLIMELEKHRKKIAKLREANHAFQEIADQIGEGEWFQIRNFCRKNSITPDPDNPHFQKGSNISPLEEFREQIEEKREQGKSLKDIQKWLKKEKKLIYTTQRISAFCLSRGFKRLLKKHRKKPESGGEKIKKANDSPLLKERETKPKIRKKKPSAENLIEDFTNQPFKIKSRKQR